MFWSLLTAVAPLVQTATAFAQTAATPAATPTAEQPGMLMSLFPFIVLFGVMYFFILRPQVKRQKDHQKFVSELRRGDEVITASGILGRIEGLTDQFVTLEIADGVRVKMVRSQVAASGKVQNEPTKAKG